MMAFALFLLAGVPRRVDVPGAVDAVEPSS
jgi:hypothetical protein